MSCSGVDDGFVVFCSVLFSVAGVFVAMHWSSSPYENFLHITPTCIKADCVLHVVMKVIVRGFKVQALCHSCRLAAHQDLVYKISYS